MITRRLFVSGSAAAAVTGVSTSPAAAQTPSQTSTGGRGRPIDRKAVVARHRVVREAINTHSPLRVGNDAVGFLLHASGGFQFDDAGLATGGPFPYFPRNGALLYAIAFMTAGWHGAPHHHAPGFPADERWVVRSEGLAPAL